MATGAASALGDIGIKKLFGKGGTKGGSMLNIPIAKRFFPMLPPIAREFTKAQIDQINKVYKTGGRLVIKPTRKQIEGGFLGTLSAIGIPMAISLVSKMFGSGLWALGSEEHLVIQKMFMLHHPLHPHMVRVIHILIDHHPFLVLGKTQ